MSTHYRRAVELYRLQRFEESIVACSLVLNETPDSTKAYAMLSMCLANLKRFPEAEKSAERAIAIGPGESIGYFALANAICSRRVTSAGMLALDRAIQIDPNNANYLTYGSRIQGARRNWRDSLAYAEAALELAPDNHDARNARAVALAKLGRRAEARDAMLGVLAESPNNPNSHLSLGQLELSRGNTAAATDHLIQALRLNPRSVPARITAKEALRSTFPPYRWAFIVSSFMSTSRELTALSIGAFYALFGAASVLAQSPSTIARATSTVCIAILAAFTVVLVLGANLIDCALQFHPLGRLVLTRLEKVQANVSVLFFF